MSKLFPNWKAADITLRTIVQDFFKLNIIAIDNNTINISFINLEDITAHIPSEYVGNFIDIYNKFVNDIAQRVELMKTLDKYMGNPLSDSMLICLQNDCLNLINKYETIENMKLKDIFLYKYLRVSVVYYQIGSDSNERRVKRTI